MPDIIIVPLRDIPGATEATSATFEAIAMRSAASSSVRVSGAEVTFPDKIRATYDGGSWDVQPALAVLPVGDYWSVTLTDVSTSKQLRRTVVLPLGVGPFDFEQLVNITPSTGQPDPSLPIWEAIVEQVTVQAGIAAGAASDATGAAEDAEQARLYTLGYRTDAQEARDDAIAAETAAQGSAGAAATSAGNAASAASTATTKAAEAVTTVATIQRGVANGVAALNSSGKALQADGKVLLDVDTGNASYVTLTAAAKNPDLLIAGAVTGDPITSAEVIWPDGSPGTLTITERHSSGAVNAYNITYGSPVTKTFTQPTITRAASGSPTNVPQIVVS